MEYSISEASRILKTTRVTVYKKIEKLEGIQEYIQVRGKNKYINEKGIELIRQSLLPSCKDYTSKDIQGVNIYTDSEDETNEESSNKDSYNVYTNDYTHRQNDIHIEYISSLKSQVEGLNKQLDVKDKQIESQENHIQALTKLNENNQVLLSQAQQKIYLIEGESLAQQEKKNWFKRWFN